MMQLNTLTSHKHCTESKSKIKDEIITHKWEVVVQIF